MILVALFYTAVKTISSLKFKLFQNPSLNSKLKNLTSEIPENICYAPISNCIKTKTATQNNTPLGSRNRSWFRSDSTLFQKRPTFLLKTSLQVKVSLTSHQKHLVFQFLKEVRTIMFATNNLFC